MKLGSMMLLTAVVCAGASAFISAQTPGSMPMTKPMAKPSTSLTITNMMGGVKTLTPEEFAALPHVTVKVHNEHNGHDESYSGVPVKDLLALPPAVPMGHGPKVSTNMIVIIAGATDDFHVVITLCDTNPDCRNGQSIVADTIDGAPLGADGAFKLVLTEDKKPARWARNLQSLTVKNLGGM